MTIWCETWRRGDWTFDITRRSDGAYLHIPDCGGMADMNARDPAQLKWAEKRLAAVPDAERVWPTGWQVRTADGLAALHTMLRHAGAECLNGEPHAWHDRE